METLQIGTFIRKVPSTWDELSRKQLLRLLPEVYAKSSPDRLLAALSGYPPYWLAGPRGAGSALPLTDWLASEQHRLTNQLPRTLAVAGCACQAAI